jgi:translation elongation factor P/translation initiation factor 5A
MESLEKIISITVLSASKSGQATETLDDGEIERVVCYSSSNDGNHNNTSMVRAEIVSNGKQIASMQPVDHFRSRNVKVEEDGKPIPNVAGRKVQIVVVADENFTADTSFDFVFIYKNNNSNCQS